MAPPRLTLSAHLVLRALLASPAHEVYGFEVIRATGLASGTVYPILARLEAEGWVKSEREEINAADEGRPARRYYTLTTAGTLQAREAVTRFAAHLAKLGITEAPAQPPGPVSIGGIEIPLVVDERQPPGIVSVVAPGEEETQVRSFALAPEPEGTRCPHPKARRNKGLCGACGTYVGK
jgi:DNA-binding MarR family transcriptional regulator